jgi:hypothetical protein
MHWCPSHVNGWTHREGSIQGECLCQVCHSCLSCLVRANYSLEASAKSRCCRSFLRSARMISVLDKVRVEGFSKQWKVVVSRSPTPCFLAELTVPSQSWLCLPRCLSASLHLCISASLFSAPRGPHLVHRFVSSPLQFVIGSSNVCNIRAAHIGSAIAQRLANSILLTQHLWPDTPNQQPQDGGIPGQNPRPRLLAARVRHDGRCCRFAAAAPVPRLYRGPSPALGKASSSPRQPPLKASRASSQSHCNCHCDTMPTALPLLRPLPHHSHHYHYYSHSGPGTVAWMSPPLSSLLP